MFILKYLSDTDNGLNSDVSAFSTFEEAKDAMRIQYDEIRKVYELEDGSDECSKSYSYSAFFGDNSASVAYDIDTIVWEIVEFPDFELKTDAVAQINWTGAPDVDYFIRENYEKFSNWAESHPSEYGKFISDVANHVDWTRLEDDSILLGNEEIKDAVTEIAMRSGIDSLLEDC